MALSDNPLHPDDMRARERDLLVRLRNGDAHAFTTLMEQYLDDVTRFASYMVQSRDLADDIVQRVFIWIWEHRTALDPNRPVKPYLFRATHNLALDEIKANNVRERYKTLEQSHESDRTIALSPETSVLDAETVRVLLDQLPTRRKLVLKLRFIDELTYDEIASILGTSPDGARQLVSRALSDFKKLYLGVSQSA
jgi:RNA polymerase sigma factor (sigma-70 family)